MLRVITVSELRRLSRSQLYALSAQMRALLADLPEGSVEYQFVLATLENIRLVLTLPGLHL